LSAVEGVYYASPNGLVFAGQGQIKNITQELLSKDKWQQLTTPATMFAARIGSAYYGFGSGLVGVFDPLSFDPLSFAQEDFDAAYTGFLVDPSNARLGFNLLSDTEVVSCVQNDPWSGELFIMKDSSLYRIDLSDPDPTRRVYIWRSKVFQSPKPRNFGAMKVYWEVPTADAPDVPVSTPDSVVPAEFPELPVGSTYGVVRLYADGALVMTRDLTTSGQLIRGPSGFKATYWQVEFETYVSIYSMQMAPTVKELSAV
jgi:hypothetical protein